ncbi:MAG: hypothetical protein ABSG99_02670 [Sedimentisphaerales bacterium]
MQSVDIVIKARDEASATFGRVGQAAGGLGSMIKRAAMAAGLYFGAREIIGFVKSNIAAYQEHEMAIEHLTESLAYLRITDKNVISGLREFAAEIQRTTTISDEMAMEVMSMGVSIGKFSSDTLKAATIAAIGYSKKFKIDLEQAMKLVAKSAEGITLGLQRQGIAFDNTKSKAEIFHDVLKRGAELYNVATGEIDTQGGSMMQLKNEWHDFKEELGGAVSGPVRGMIDGFRVAIVIIENWRLSLDIAWTAVKLGLINFWEDIKHFFGTAMPAYLTYFAENWRQIFTNIWNATTTIFANMWTNIKDFFVAVWTWLKGGEADWKWTGLLEGFESTLKELPVIAARELTKTELALKEQLGGLTLEMSKKIVEVFYPTAIDIGEILKNAKLPEGVLEKGTKAKKKSEQKLPWEEAVRLTFAPGTKFDKTERNTDETAKNTGRMARLIENTNKTLNNVIDAVKALDVTQAISNFK